MLVNVKFFKRIFLVSTFILLSANLTANEKNQIISKHRMTKLSDLNQKNSPGSKLNSSSVYKLPMLDVNDLGSIICKIIETTPESPYVVAVDKSQNTMREIVTRRLSMEVPSSFVATTTAVTVFIFSGIGAVSVNWVPISFDNLVNLFAASIFLAGGYLFSVLVILSE